MEKIIKKIYFSCKKKMIDEKPQTYCQCDGCFDVTTVSVLKFPQTKYWDHKHLTTKYTTRWYCDKCLHKLTKAVNDDRIAHMFSDD